MPCPSRGVRHLWDARADATHPRDGGNWMNDWNPVPHSWRRFLLLLLLLLFFFLFLLASWDYQIFCKLKTHTEVDTLEAHSGFEWAGAQAIEFPYQVEGCEVLELLIEGQFVASYDTVLLLQ